MKLAEALRERADIQKKIAQLSHRISENARVHEGDTPDEDPVELLAEARGAMIRLEELVRRINQTNAVTPLSAGMTLTDAMARREWLAGLQKFLTSAADAAGGAGNDRIWGRRRATELREVAAFPVKDLRTEADQVSGELRKLSISIEEMNWKTELV
jgi:hypothetical protein